MKRNSNFLNKSSESISTKMTLNSQKLLTGVLALVLVTGMISPAFALTVDDFDEGGPTVLTGTGGGSDSLADGGLDALKTLGGERFTEVTHQAGPTDIMAQQNPPAGLMSFSSDALNTGLFQLTYDAGGAGLGGVDFTKGSTADRLLIDLVSADAGSSITVVLTDQGGDTLTRTENAPAAGQLVYLFANFVGIGDFTDIDKVEVTFQGTIDGDYVVDLIGIPQTRIGGEVGSMNTATLLVAGAQANMGLWSLALVGIVGAGAAITYKLKSNKTEQ